MVGSTHTDTAQDTRKKRRPVGEATVGDLDEVGEFGLGVAPKDAKPINKIEMSKAKEEEIARMQEETDEERDDLNEIDEEEEKKMEIIKLKKQ